MTLLRPSHVDAHADDRVFRAPPWPSLVVALTIAASGVGCLYFGRLQPPGFDRYLPYYVGGFMLFGLILCQRYVTARFRPTNWLARVSTVGVSIQFRSYLNYALPDTDETVVFIPYAEIRSARFVKQRMTFVDAQGRRAKQTLRFVEFDLSADLGPLSKALAGERARRAPMEKHWYGTSSTLFNDYPVQSEAPSFVRVRWSASPGAAAFLDTIGARVHIAPAVSLSDDLSQLGAKSREQQHEYLRKLDASGNTIAAIYTARRLYGFGLTEAKDFVDRLRGEAGAAISR